MCGIGFTVYMYNAIFAFGIMMMMMCYGYMYSAMPMRKKKINNIQQLSLVTCAIKPTPTIIAF